jgi:hypothetical protein
MARKNCSINREKFRDTFSLCSRCGWPLGPNGTCRACQFRQMESARHRRVLNWPEEPDPWQENAIRALEDQLE